MARQDEARSGWPTAKPGGRGGGSGSSTSRRATNDSGTQSRAAPAAGPTRSGQTIVAIGPSPVMLKTSGPTRST